MMFIGKSAEFIVLVVWLYDQPYPPFRVVVPLLIIVSQKKLPVKELSAN